MKILVLLLFSLPLLAKDPVLKNGYYLTDYNLKIEADCSERVPVNKLSQFYQMTMNEGRACLARLTNYGDQGNQINSCFDQLFTDKKNPPKLMCGGWPFGNDIGAVGSFPGSSKRHPYLWLGPRLKNLLQNDPNELKSMVFHEMIHNCGYLHSEGIEAAYTCEDCCFNKNLASDKKEIACRICGGAYKNEFDIEYQKSLLIWSSDSLVWGRDMRRNVFMAANKSQRLDSFELLLSHITNNEKEKQFLRPIFLERSQQTKKNLISEFEQNFMMTLTSNIKLQQLIEWFKVSLH